ncbi:hypothetical protein E0K83_06480 [Gramella sp. BOM4]|nr:hypothetical protein [Christiangramia bathymodioli]
MSKNGSRSATKYFGKRWSPGGSPSNPSIFFKPIDTGKKKKRTSKTSQDFKELCNLFGTESSLQGESLKLFRRLSIKKRALALKGVNSYKAYCGYANQPFLLKSYLIDKPFIKRRKAKKKKKLKTLNKKIVPKRKSKSHTIAENIDESTLAKLKQLIKKK